MIIIIYFILFIHSFWNKLFILFSKYTLKFSFFLFFFWAENQHIRIISEGSCDTEDWSNDAENTALHLRNKLLFKIYSNINQFFKIVIIFCYIFHQTNAALFTVVTSLQIFWTVA